MTDHVSNSASEDRTMPAVVYALYLVGLTHGLTIIIGLILAYVSRSAAGPVMQSHYTFQIRTFWIGLLYAAIGVVLTMAVIGIFVLFAVFVWWVVRCVKGLKFAGARQPIPEPTTWKW